MIRNLGPLSDPKIPFLNSLQEEIASVIEFGEMNIGAGGNQLQRAIERIGFGFRSVNSFQKSVLDLTLTAGQVYLLPTYGLYAIGILKDSYDRIVLREINGPLVLQGFGIALKDKTLQITNQGSDCSLTVFLEFELEVLT